MQTQFILPQPTQLPQPTTNPNLPRPMQFLAQPVPNPNNHPTHHDFNVEMSKFPTYVVTLVPLQNIHLRSKKVLKPKYYTIIIREETQEEETTEQTNNDDHLEEVVIATTQTPSTSCFQKP
jgi:hypothetical protein